MVILIGYQGAASPKPPNVGQDPSRLRTTLANGSILLVEPSPETKNLTLHLFAASRGVDESKTSGIRHLLEHLCVKGVDGTLDTRLESVGGFLQARTLRDALDIQVDVPPGKLNTALGALAEVLHASPWTTTDIAREAGVIEQEVALQPADAILTAALWAQAYGGNGADPMGDLATIKATSPDALEENRKATFATGNLLLVIEGPIGLSAGTKQGVAFLAKLPATKVASAVERVPRAGPGRVEVEAFGEARGVPVPSLSDPRCVARICAALAIASELKDAFVTYTPSAANGMVVVGQVGEVGKLGKLIDGLDDGAADDMLARARLLGARWAAAQVGTPAASAYTRGLLMCRNARFRFDSVEDAMVHVSVSDFRAAIASFGASRAFVSVGLP